MKYVFMYKHKEEHRIVKMAKVLEVSESGYYKWLKRKPSKRANEDIELITTIKHLYDNAYGIYGARKITIVLNKLRKNDGKKPVNHKRVERLMSEYQLFAKVHKKYKATTNSNHNNKYAENILKRDFTVSGPNEKMVSDTKAIRTRQGWLYAAAIIDLFGRRPVGLATSTNNDEPLTITALSDMHERGYGKPGTYIHSDRGITYCAEEYQKLVKKYGLICSMSRKGDCWDNAPMESFWGKMEQEWLKDIYDTIEEAREDVFEYTWHFYTNIRIHASNGYMTPAEFYQQGPIS